MKTTKRLTGDRGEDEACRYLESLGHTVVARNWRSLHLELDAVTLTPGKIHFVEVKTRKVPLAADPTVNVDRAKMTHMVKAATRFLHSEKMKGLPPGLEVIFDVVTVVIALDGSTDIEYYPQAFIPMYV